MDEERSGAMIDDDLDRELQAMLGVDPSPALVARVRTRIADEPQRSTLPYSMFALAGAVAAAIAIVAFINVRDRRAIVSPTASAPLHARAIAADLVAPDVAPVARPRQRAMPIAESARRSMEPEVLIDPRERAALLALIHGTRDGGIDLAPALEVSTPTVMELPPLVAIEIPEITIDPIAPPPGEQGVRQ
jgi:hypothetical protein